MNIFLMTDDEIKTLFMLQEFLQMANYIIKQSGKRRDYHEVTINNMARNQKECAELELETLEWLVNFRTSNILTLCHTGK